MSDNQNWRNIGEQMKNELTHALQTGDFKQLNNLVSQTVANTLNEVGIHIMPDGSQNSNQYGSSSFPGNSEADFRTSRAAGQGMHNGHDNTPKNGNVTPNQKQFSYMYEQAGHGHEQASHRNEQTFHRWGKSSNDKTKSMQNWIKAPAAPPVKIKKVGDISNVLYQIFGGAGFFITVLIALIEMTVYLAGGIYSTAGCITTLFFLAFFWGMIRLGVSQKRRIRRAMRYVQLCGNKMFEDIRNLAGSTGSDERYVVKDIQKMLQIGIFPEGHLDSNKTCFMLNDTVYNQYLEAEKSRMQREEEKKRQISQNEDSKTPKSDTISDNLSEQETELNAIISEGMACIRKLRDLNDKISGEVISSKLFRLENLLKDIFERVQEHPEQMNRMHKLMSYYLPTTLKLIETYEEFDQISSPGKEITDAKAEIENTLDTINQAFSELLNNLFQDAVFDATTDAQVLKTMLAREGLMNEMDFAAIRTEK